MVMPDTFMITIIFKSQLYNHINASTEPVILGRNLPKTLRLKSMEIGMNANLYSVLIFEEHNRSAHTVNLFMLQNIILI